MVLGFFAVDNFDFTKKIVKKVLGEKLVKMLGVIKIEFLDKNLTFRIVYVSKQALIYFWWVRLLEFSKGGSFINR